jgi:hypothetical protein
MGVAVGDAAGIGVEAGAGALEHPASRIASPASEIPRSVQQALERFNERKEAVSLMTFEICPPFNIDKYPESSK